MWEKIKALFRYIPPLPSTLFVPMAVATTPVLVESSSRKPPEGKKDSQDIGDAHIYLQERWPKLKDKFEQTYPGYTLKIIFVWRSVAFQAELYDQGRRGIAGEHIVTNCDGTTNPSHHNFWPSLAIDVAIYKDGIVKWADAEYDKITPMAQELGLVHGATWTSFNDPQHLEVPKDIIRTANYKS